MAQSVLPRNQSLVPIDENCLPQLPWACRVPQSQPPKQETLDMFPFNSLVLKDVVGMKLSTAMAKQLFELADEKGIAIHERLTIEEDDELMDGVVLATMNDGESALITDIGFWNTALDLDLEIEL